MTSLELLAPARNLSTGIAAIDCGADAVYIGASHHGARAAAANSVDDIRRLCEYAHRFRAKVYVTLNTLIYDNEIAEVEALVRDLYIGGVDALIVQDMALLRMNIPPIPLHASTQCDIRTPEKAAFLEKVGFSQLVIPREASLEEIRRFRSVTSVPLEAFVHGALCVSYSGDCRASFVNGGRSANRGECAQICRLPYNLTDGKGNRIATGRHLLSLKDMNRMAFLSQMVDAGISSFKIEGRLKSEEYVRNVTAAYSQSLNEVIKLHPDKYRRSSSGHSVPAFTPDVNLAFNRGFTNYFLTASQTARGELLSGLSPKHVGAPLATVVSCGKRKITVKTRNEIANGDGLIYFDKNGMQHGLRVNNTDGSVIMLSAEPDKYPSPGTVLYRNFDKRFNDNILRAVSRRFISVKAALRPTLDGISLTFTDERGCSVTSCLNTEKKDAQKPQTAERHRVLTKTGDTIYRITDVMDFLGDTCFVPLSVLTSLRRQVVRLLDHAAAATYPAQIRRSEDSNSSTVPFPKKVLDMHDNVANRLAADFYRSHGATISEPALETNSRPSEELVVMTTRYCLRRELGICLKAPEGRCVPEPLSLQSTDNKTLPMKCRFDCAQCRMHLVVKP